MSSYPSEVASLRIGVLARLSDAVALAETPWQVALRAAAVLRQNDAETPLVWLLKVVQQGYGDGSPSVSATSPVADPAGQHAAAVHALAVAAASSGRHEVLPCLARSASQSCTRARSSNRGRRHPRSSWLSAAQAG